MKKIDYSLTLKQIYIKALPVTILLIIGATLVYQLLWNNLFAALSNLWLRIYIFIPAILILSLLHEVLHILGFWLLGKTRRQDWHIGIKSG
ncbi:MAG TPA: hypothetical protein DHM37_02510, partial [Candidatus Cloacimonas sp.]|nr:hypothetical protein [Candidatus Cloacimonas sp.]